MLIQHFPLQEHARNDEFDDDDDDADSYFGSESGNNNIIS